MRYINPIIITIIIIDLWPLIRRSDKEVTVDTCIFVQDLHIDPFTLVIWHIW